MSPSIALSENGDKKMTIEELLASCGVGSPEELIKMIGEMKGNIEASQAEVKMLNEKIMCSEKSTSFNVMLSEKKVCEAQREAFLKGDVVEFAKNAQVMKFDEISTSADADVNEKSAEDKVLELAEKKVKEEKMPMAKAIAVVLSENPELNKQYRGE